MQAHQHSAAGRPPTPQRVFWCIRYVLNALSLLSFVRISLATFNNDGSSSSSSTNLALGGFSENLESCRSRPASNAPVCCHHSNRAMVHCVSVLETVSLALLPSEATQI